MFLALCAFSVYQCLNCMLVTRYFPLGINFVLVVLSGFLYLLGTWIAFEVTHDASWLVYCSIGFSGVLFGLVVLETKLGDQVFEFRNMTFASRQSLTESVGI